MITDADILDIAREMIWTVIKCAMPLLIVSLIVGLIISIFQTITSIQEQTLTFVPKLIAIFVALLLLGGWIMGQCVEFLENMCTSFANYV